MNDRGYEIVDAVFSRADTQRIVSAIDAAPLARTKAGARHVLSMPVVSEIANHARMRAIAARHVSGAAVPFRATLFDKSPASNWLVAWHQDTALPLRERNDDAAWGPWSTKSGVLYAHAPAWALETVVALRLSLDDSTVSNGPLRVLPGSHARGVLDEAEIAALARETPAVDCTVAAGGVVVMRPLTVHASSKSKDDRPRRVLHIEYAASAVLASGVHLAIS